MQNVMHIASNAGHTTQNDSFRSPPGPQGTPPTPILEKTLVSRNDFRTLGTKKNRK